MDLGDLKVQEVMSRSVFTVPLDAKLDDILNEMLTNNISAVIVVAPNGEFMGVVSRSDIIKALSKHRENVFNITAEDIMSAKPIRVDGDTPLKEAAAIMTKNKVHRVLVLTSHLGKLIPVGVLSAIDIVKQIKF